MGIILPKVTVPDPHPLLAPMPIRAFPVQGLRRVAAAPHQAVVEVEAT